MASRSFSASDRPSPDKATVIALSAAFGFMTAVGSMLLGYSLPSSTLNVPLVHHDLGDTVGYAIVCALPGFVFMAAALATAYLRWLRSRALVSSLTILSLVAVVAQGITGYSGYALLTWCRCGSWFYREHIAGDFLIDLWFFFVPGIVAALLVAWAIGKSGH